MRRHVTTYYTVKELVLNSVLFCCDKFNLFSVIKYTFFVCSINRLVHWSHMGLLNHTKYCRKKIFHSEALANYTRMFSGVSGSLTRLLMKDPAGVEILSAKL